MEDARGRARGTRQARTSLHLTSSARAGELAQLLHALCVGALLRDPQLGKRGAEATAAAESAGSGVSLSARSRVSEPVLVAIAERAAAPDFSDSSAIARVRSKSASGT